ncbi:unnamed protein product [Blepharisma stoltei]|uniref:Uncharacterized protein n=1 Tax=Blepharisma stoltei TaxID=1481888 RepID=A0AAU9IAC7_9CILI|nr:unnamed protein product [Blepharisma stoltei]
MKEAPLVEAQDKGTIQPKRKMKGLKQWSRSKKSQEDWEIWIWDNLPWSGVHMIFKWEQLTKASRMAWIKCLMAY